MLVVEVVLIAVVLFAVAAVATGAVGPDRDPDDAAALPNSTLPAAGEPIRAADLRSVRIPVSLRGYRMRDVDELLERLAVALDERDEQLDRMRAGNADREQVSGAPDGPFRAGEAGETGRPSPATDRASDT